MKTKKEDNSVKVVLHTSFEFAHWDNVVNTAMALAQSGYFTNILKGSGAYILNVYKRF